MGSWQLQPATLGRMASTSASTVVHPQAVNRSNLLGVVFSSCTSQRAPTRRISWGWRTLLLLIQWAHALLHDSVRANTVTLMSY